MSKTVAIIQARLASTRLPGKVLQDIAGKPMLEWVVERTRQSKFTDDVVIATTLDPADDRLFAFCVERNYLVTRGSALDVLDRYYQTAKALQAQFVIRITADCPLIDPLLIDETASLLLGNLERDVEAGNLGVDPFVFAANRLPPPWGRTYPIGLDVEAFTFDLLHDAWRNATEKYQREHVAPYFYQDALVDDLQFNGSNSPFASTTTPKGYRIALRHHTCDLGHLRWTVDTSADLKLVRAIAASFPDLVFGWHDILALIQQNPEFTLINAHVPHKTHLDVDHRDV